MQTIVIETKTEKDYQFVIEFLKRMDISIKISEDTPNETTLNAISEKSSSKVFKTTKSLMKDLDD